MNNVPRSDDLLPGELFAAPYNCPRQTETQIMQLIVKRATPGPTPA